MTYMDMNRRTFILSVVATVASAAVPAYALPKSSSLEAGEIYGLFVSTHEGHVHVSPGRCRDAADTCDIKISDTLVPAQELTDGTWHMYAIAGDGVEDSVIFSTQVRNPDLPAGYTAYRRFASLPRSNGRWPEVETFVDVFVLKPLQTPTH